jgi:integrase
MSTLTELKAKNIKPDSPVLPHGGVTGLTLHPSTSKGHGKWVMRYVSPVTSKRRNAGLGSYPEISIADAAKKALSFREQLSDGIDPLEQKANDLQGTLIPNFEQAAITHHGELKSGWKNPKHAQQWLNTLTQYAFPNIGKLPLDQIQPRHVADLLRPIWLEKAETASRVKQRIHAVMSWGWAHGHCQSNPADVADRLLAAQPSKAIRTKHHPAMPWKDIPAFHVEHLKNATQYDVTRTMLTMLVLTSVRSGEVRGMRWDEIDFNKALWTIPADRMKAKIVHRVPLSEQAIGLIKRMQGLHEELIFPSPRREQVLSDMAMTKFLRRVDAKSDTPDRVATAHGFRSSFKDWCSENGYSRDLSERSLAHTIENKVEAAYHRTDLLEQRRPMMQTWADFVTGTKPQIKIPQNILNIIGNNL